MDAFSRVRGQECSSRRRGSGAVVRRGRCRAASSVAPQRRGVAVSPAEWLRCGCLALACALLPLVGCSSTTSSDTAPTPTTSPTAVDSKAPAPDTVGGLKPRSYLLELRDGEAAGCLPGCASDGRTRPGRLPNGTYQTEWFFGGYMTLTQDIGWSGLEDSTGELKLIPPGGTDYGVGFALDVFPVRGDRAVDPKPGTIREWIRWYRSNRDLDVSGSTSTKIGEIPATRIDLAISKTATNDDPGCPAGVCVNVWGFPTYPHFGGIAGDDIYRQYLAEVRYSGKRHMFFVTVESRDAADLAEITPTVEDLLETVTLPAVPG